MLDKLLVLPSASDIRAARASLNWKQTDLAYKCQINLNTVAFIENEKSKPSKETLEIIAKVFLEEGIYFLPGGGFKVEKNIIKTYEGEEGYLKVIEDAMRSCALNKSEFLLLGASDKKSSNKVNDLYKRMYKAGIAFRQLISKEDDYILGPLEDYRQIDKNYFLSDDVLLIYANKIVFITEIEGDLENYILTKIKYIVIENASMTRQLRAYFYRLWDTGKKPIKSSAKQIFFKNKKKEK